MTFFEAAVEILRESGRPLHFKKITELAIGRSLLSHIGKTPEVTMEARLNQEADKPGSTIIRRVRPGVYELAQGLEARALRDTARPATAPPAAAPEPAAKISVPEPADQEFPEPTLVAGGDPRTPRPEEEAGNDRGRRRRRSRGAQEREPGPTGAVPVSAPPVSPTTSGAPMLRAASTPSLGSARSSSGPAAGPRLLAGAPPGRAETSLSLAPAPRAVPDEPAEAASSADHAHAVLARANGPLRLGDLSQELQQVTGRAASAATLEQILLADNRRQLEAGRCPRFVRLGPAWTVAERALGRALQEAFGALDRARAAVAEHGVRDLARAIAELRGPDLEAFCLATLEGLEFATRPLDQAAEATYFEATADGQLLPLKAIAAVWHGARAVSADEVAALRGRLHRWGATHGILVVVGPGRITPSARSEAGAAAALPVVLLDADALAPLALRAGVGVTQSWLRIALPDPAWFPPPSR